MSVKLLTDHHLEFLSVKGGSSESTHVKMPHCWKSHATAHFIPSKHLKAGTYRPVVVTTDCGLRLPGCLAFCFILQDMCTFSDFCPVSVKIQNANTCVD